MKIRIGGRKRIQFTDKKHPARGIFSSVIAVVSFIMMCALFIGSSHVKGNAGILYGYLGFLNMIFSGIGFTLAFRCFKEEEIYKTTPAIGVTLNGLILIDYVILYILGVL
ncbi:MAG: DUF6142 family protein [Eubacterium sp.]